MNLKRKIRIFWLEHGSPIIMVAVALGIIIFIVQTLNKYALQKQEEQQQNQASTSQNVVASETIEIEKMQEKETVEKFIKYNQNNQIEKAYSMLSNTCKQASYQNINIYQEKYFMQRFLENRETEVTNQEGNTYVIQYFKTEATTKNKTEAVATDTCKIETDGTIYVQPNE